MATTLAQVASDTPLKCCMHVTAAGETFRILPNVAMQNPCGATHPDRVTNCGSQGRAYELLLEELEDPEEPDPVPAA